MTQVLSYNQVTYSWTFCAPLLYVLMVVMHIFLQAGVSKLNEAKELVDNLKRKAAEQSLVLAEKQTEADNSLKEITTTMQAS